MNSCLFPLSISLHTITGMSNPLSHSDGDSSTDDAIANLTAAINQLLTRSYRSSCHLVKMIVIQLVPYNLLYHNNYYLTHQLNYYLICVKSSRCPYCLSDYYIITDNCSIAHHVYCYMEELCNSTGGWIRVAYLNMTDSSEKCPDGFKSYNENGVQACDRSVSSGGSCAGITFPSGNIEYSQVCGKVIGYQCGSPNGTVGSNVNGVYIKGISLTHGSPRKHIWSFI